MSQKAAHRFNVAFFLMSLVMIVGGSISISYATNGYLPQGYGTTNNGLAGAGVAFPQDTLAAATNPAGMASLGNRYDAGISFFNPNRQFTVTGNPSGAPGTFGLPPGTFGSDTRLFIIPSFGANWSLNNESSIGLSIYGQGGMNTDYNTTTTPPSPFGHTPTGVDLSQLFIVPTYATKLFSNHSIGISPVLAYQRFEAKGLQAFAPYSSNPADLTNNGHADSYGYGAKIGYLGKILPQLNIGASYHSRTYMTKFSDYAGLFSGQGAFDIPSSWDAGLSYQVVPSLTFLFDVQQINYSEVKSIANPLLPNLQPGTLGNDNGAGFGWRDMTIYKLGVQWQSSEEWIWRAGYSAGNQPIPNSEMLFNIIAPGVIQQHAAVGFTKSLPNHQAFNFALVRAFSNSVSGPNTLEAPGQQNIELKMDEWEADFSYSWNLPGSI